ncbi:MAG: NAD(P)H-dependent oxidoreductase [Ignavibacteria bacterium]|nr:NAD(P)H-dependent oxidoreductase [Ignavibacteria bacterium]
MKIAILCGTVRTKREGNHVAKFMLNQLNGRGIEAKIIDPADFQLPLLDVVFSQMENPEDKFVAIHNILSDADGFIIVTAEYNHSIPPALKNLLDHYRIEYFFKPSGIVSYSSGPFGGIRAAEHMKQICSELKTPAIPSSFPISHVHESIGANGEALDENYNRRCASFLNEFVWYVEALSAQRAKGTPY